MRIQTKYRKLFGKIIEVMTKDKIPLNGDCIDGSKSKSVREENF